LGQRFSQSIPQSRITLPSSAAALIEQYNTAREHVEKYEELKREAENRLKEMLGVNETGIVENSVITWKNVSQERFDSKLFESEQPDVYKQYMRRTSYRRFAVKEIQRVELNQAA
jgi:predicted phage-related endonuclease